MEFRKLLIASMLFSCTAMAENTNTLTVKMNDALPDGIGKSIGEITVSETPFGLLFTPDIHGLTLVFTVFIFIQTRPVCLESRMVKACRHLWREVTSIRKNR